MGIDVGFTSVSDDVGRNKAFSENDTEEAPGENRGNFANRGVLISDKTSGRGGWKLTKRRRQDSDACSSIAEAGFNGGSLCSFYRIVMYNNYLRGDIRNMKSLNPIGGEMRFVLRNRASRDSTHAAVIPIWVGK